MSPKIWLRSDATSTYSAGIPRIVPFWVKSRWHRCRSAVEEYFGAPPHIPPNISLKSSCFRSCPTVSPAFPLPGESCCWSVASSWSSVSSRPDALTLVPAAVDADQGLKGGTKRSAYAAPHLTYVHHVEYFVSEVLSQTTTHSRGIMNLIGNARV